MKVWKDYGVTVEDGGETHSYFIYVIDRHGNFRETFLPDSLPVDIAADARAPPGGMTKKMPRREIYKRILFSMLAGILFGVVISEMTFYFLNTGETRPPQVVKLNIPLGTAERVARGEVGSDFAASMVFVVGDTLMVKNFDSVVHQLGPLFIPSGSSASMKLRFRTGLCLYLFF